jgi:hypothetical protein
MLREGTKEESLEGLERAEGKDASGCAKQSRGGGSAARAVVVSGINPRSELAMHVGAPSRVVLAGGARPTFDPCTATRGGHTGGTDMWEDVDYVSAFDVGVHLVCAELGSPKTRVRRSHRSRAGATLLDPVVPCECADLSHCVLRTLRDVGYERCLRVGAATSGVGWLSIVLAE